MVFCWESGVRWSYFLWSTDTLPVIILLSDHSSSLLSGLWQFSLNLAASDTFIIILISIKHDVLSCPDVPVNLALKTCTNTHTHTHTLSNVHLLAHCKPAGHRSQQIRARNTLTFPSDPESLSRLVFVQIPVVMMGSFWTKASLFGPTDLKCPYYG